MLVTTQILCETHTAHREFFLSYRDFVKAKPEKIQTL